MVLEVAVAVRALIDILSMTAVGSLIVVPIVHAADTCVASMRADTQQRERRERREQQPPAAAKTHTCDDANDDHIVQHSSESHLI
jgi:hypothetical protein